MEATVGHFRWPYVDGRPVHWKQPQKILDVLIEAAGQPNFLAPTARRRR